MKAAMYIGTVFYFVLMLMYAVVKGLWVGIMVYWYAPRPEDSASAIIAGTLVGLAVFSLAFLGWWYLVKPYRDSILRRYYGRV